jgi:hypothetical protein
MGWVPVSDGDHHVLFSASRTFFANAVILAESREPDIHFGYGPLNKLNSLYDSVFVLPVGKKDIVCPGWYAVNMVIA